MLKRKTVPVEESADEDIETGHLLLPKDYDARTKKRQSASFSFFHLWTVHARVVWCLWLVVFFWGEWLSSRLAVHAPSCAWADADLSHLGLQYHLAVIADPQLTDFYSYNMTPKSWTLTLTEFYSDLYMRRNFQQLMRKSTTPDSVLVLGDLFDGGIYATYCKCFCVVYVFSV
jgi:hypothetical protein